MASVTANGITIAYQRAGVAGDPALVLLMGLGSQSTHWPDDFWQALAARGFDVIRPDNRDVGLSQRFAENGTPDLGAAIERLRRGEPVDAPYRLSDMADDVDGLLHALSIPQAHIVGVSMGGAIAQLVAARHGARVKSLVSIMSGSGDPATLLANPGARDMLGVEPADPGDREAVIAAKVAVYQATGGPGFPWPEVDLRAHVTRNFDRAYDPAGEQRQTLAILASGGRTALLPKITAPTLVIHGADDPLVPADAGRQTARLIPGAVFHLIAGMGHTLAPGLRPVLVDLIANHCRAAESQL